MRRRLGIIILALMVVQSAGAESVAPTVTTPSGAATLELKNKSAFTLEEAGRNPFWPIGWRPIAKPGDAVTTEQVGADIPPSAFLVSSITMDHGAGYAIINGRVMQVGQVFGLQLGSQTFQITVKAIEDGRVILLRRDQEIVVSLRRR